MRQGPLSPDLARRLSKEEINSLPIGGYKGPIRLIQSPEALDEAVRLLSRESLLGFDTETRPAYHKGESYPPSLLQLAGVDTVYLFQLKRTGLPDPLRKILADPAIIKAGVSLDYDLRELASLAPFTPGGFVDLGRLAKKMGISHHGLRGLAALLLGIRIPKGARTSNWAREQLDPGQIRYAATDAWVGRELAKRLLAAAGPFPSSGDSRP